MKIEYLQGSKVISIEPARQQAKFPAIAQVEAYWDGLRNGRLMPARSEIDPRGISDALEYAFILEKIAPGLARIRLAGTHLNALLGMEVRGMPITAFFVPEARADIREALESTLEAPASLRLSLKGDSGFTRPKLDAQMFLAPLKDESGVPTRILGVLQSSGKIGRGPRRFSVRSSVANPLLTDPASAAMRRLPGYADHATGRAAAAQPDHAPAAGGQPHLRLVTDNTN